MAFVSHEHGGVVYHTAENLSAQPGVVHGFSTRLGGVSRGDLASLNLRPAKPSGDEPENVVENYRRFCAAIGAQAENVVFSQQVHTDNIRAVTGEDRGKGLWSPRDYEADALITNERGLFLTVFSADCIIILLSDAQAGCVGAVHAGWRGTALGIAAKAVKEMIRRYGASPERMEAAIGAGIGPCCFETHNDVPQAMKKTLGEEAAPYCIPKGEKWRVDLKGLNRHWLEKAGLQPGHIQISPLCTACHPELYWSHRKMGEKRGVQCAMIGLK